jgi:hypothetical protein
MIRMEAEHPIRLERDEAMLNKHISLDRHWHHEAPSYLICQDPGSMHPGQTWPRDQVSFHASCGC